MCVMVYGMTTEAQVSIVAVEPVVEKGRNLLAATTLACKIKNVHSALVVRCRHENDTFTEANSGKYEVTINLAISLY